MKKFLPLFFLGISFLILVPETDSGQSASQVKNTITLPLEKIFLFTDRNIYTLNEKIWFSAGYSIDTSFHGKDWSTVLYVELTGHSGQSVVRGKFPLTINGAHGDLLIPSDLPTGLYYLKAYTKWMRNFSAENYAWQILKIINPLSDKAITTNDSNLKKDNTSVDRAQVGSGITCSSDKEHYARREKVEVSVRVVGKTILSNMASIAVAKTGTSSNPIYSEQTGNKIKLKEFTYYPEIRGITLSGKIIDPKNGNVTENALVQLSLLNNKSFYSGYYTDRMGEFLVSLPNATGVHDFYIEATKEGSPLKIQIDDEFCTKPFVPQTIPFELSAQEKEIAYEICVNKQIESAFSNQLNTSPAGSTEPDNIRISFYGDPVKTIFTKKYINLPNLEEFFFELIPEFTIEYIRKVPFIKPSFATSFGAWPALVLLDNVPVTNLSKILALPVDKIERIELIDKGYVSGDIRYNGIIHAFSKNRDLAGIDLPENSMFFNFRLFSPSDSIRFPEYSEKSMNKRIPDRRNTLYWNPCIRLQSGIEQKFTFYTADLKGEYEVVVRGLTDNGQHIITGKTRFIVE